MDQFILYGVTDQVCVCFQIPFLEDADPVGVYILAADV